jgi:hypothetical protein
MAGQTSIVNLTLTHLGQEHVLSIDEAAKAAVKIKGVWQTIVDDMLTEHDWTFARKRASLARLDEAPAWGFAYYYQLPGDYLKLPDPDKHGNEQDNIWSLQPWRKEGDTILTDEAVVELLYIARVQPEKFSVKFGVALSYRLAATVAYDLTQNASLSKSLWQIYAMILVDAKHADSREIGKVVKTSTWLSSRS